MDVYPLDDGAADLLHRVVPLGRVRLVDAAHVFVQEAALQRLLVCASATITVTVTMTITINTINTISTINTIITSMICLSLVSLHASRMSN